MLMAKFLLCFLLIAMTGGELQPGRNNLQTKHVKMEASQPEHPESSDLSKMEKNIEVKPDETQMPLRHEHSGTSVHSKCGRCIETVRGRKHLVLQRKHPKSSVHLNRVVTKYSNKNLKATNDPRFVPYPLKHTKDHMRSEATSSLRKSNLTHAKTHNQFKQIPSSEEMKNKPTKKIESDIPIQKQFMFAARSKLPDLIKQINWNGPSSSAASNNVFEQNTCSNEQRQSVTFEQAKDSIIHAWQQCDGNPHCQLMQILGGIDNTLELQDWLIEQISFLNKLFVIQRKLITDIYDVHSKILLEKHNHTNNNTADAEIHIMKSLQNETENYKHDIEKSLLTKSDSQDEYNDFVKPLNDKYASNMIMKGSDGKQATSKKNSTFAKSPRAIDKHKRKLRASRNKLNKKNAHVKKVEQSDIINVQTKHTALSADEETVGNKTEGEIESLTPFQSRKLLEAQSEQTLEKRCDQGRDLNASTSAGCKKQRSPSEYLGWMFAKIGLYCVIGGIYACYCLFPQDHNFIYRACVVSAAIIVYTIYIILALKVIAILDLIMCLN